MITESKSSGEKKEFSRRNFMRYGGLLVGGNLASNNGNRLPFTHAPEEDEPKIKRFKLLGRTGFKVSDIGMGNTRNKEVNVVRYVYNHGVNYIDTAESYQNSTSEKIIGEALKYMNRKKVFITTKLHISERDTEQTILNRYRKCLARLDSDYFDALYIHNPGVVLLKHEGFHTAFKNLKREGKVRFMGVSSHGGRSGRDDEMKNVLLSAVADGRFDMMLMVYNFMNHKIADEVISACREKNIGTTAMKTSPGVLKVAEFDPENLTKQQKEYIQRFARRGRSKETALASLKKRIKKQKETYQKTKPFIEKYGLKTAFDLRRTGIHWAMQNPELHTVCVSFADFDLVDKIIPLSGTQLSHVEDAYLRDFKYTYDDQYCRHGCADCNGSCPHDLPVSAIMRYAYYYEYQGGEKEAILKYARLDSRNASLCRNCDAPCLSACPYQLNVRTQLLQAHEMLTLA
ncbi:MAG TPA: hypothetical protein ENH29_04100 [Bacteroidetes bacterium]|nr:hypothetical protein [Bacteroidota bacterium]